MRRDLIIEVQGEYWHSLRHVIIKDKQKHTYVRRHTNYDLMYLEELDLSSWDEVAAKFQSYGLDLVSYSDCTYGHDGTVYKSCGYKIIGPDYYYISKNGRYHKKTIWDMSKRFKMSENEYAIKHGLRRVYGGQKLRWVYELER